MKGGAYGVEIAVRNEDLVWLFIRPMPMRSNINSKLRTAYMYMNN
jgi:hypothetical protein